MATNSEAEVEIEAPLPSSWWRAGGPNGEGRLSFRISGMWLNPAITETITAVDVRLTGECEAMKVMIDESANADCVLGQWTAESECSSMCGAGTRTRKRYIIFQAKGSGMPCPPADCGAGIGCISGTLPCNGAEDNPGACTQCTPGTFNCKVSGFFF